MTSQAELLTAPPTDVPPTDHRRSRPRSVTVAELAVVMAGIVVASTVVVALVSGLLGAFDLTVVFVGVTALVVASVAVMLLRPVRVRLEPLDLAFAAVVAVLAGVMFFPGGDYVSGDRDPGVYVAHAVAIAREGSIVIDDPIASRAGEVPVVNSDPAPVRGPHGRFPGLWPAPGDDEAMKPQFYDAYAAFLAVGYAAGGTAGLTALGPMCGVLAVVAFTLALRRVFGATTAAIGAVLLVTNVLQVWQARYPTAEMLSQALVAVGVLGLVLAVDARWRPAAALAGVLTGVVFLVRPDGFLLVLGAAVAGAALVAIDRFGRRAWWFAAGLVAVLPLALYEAYGLNDAYTIANSAPGGRRLLMLLAGTAVLAMLGRGVMMVAGPRLATTDAQVWQRRIGIVAVIGFTAFLAVAAARPLFIDEVTATTSRGTVVPIYSEETVSRLAWVFSPLGIALLAAGVGVIVLSPWRANRFALAIPLVALVPVYLWDPHISSRLMWWGRRFIPIAILGMVLLIAVALGWAWRAKGRFAVGLHSAAVLAVLVLTAFQLRTSLPVTGHREFAGVWQLADDLAALSGDQQGLYLWALPGGGVYDPTRVLGGPLWLVADQLSAVLPPEPSEADLQAFLDAFPDAPVFVITAGNPPPGATATVIGDDPPRLAGTWTIPQWEESDTHLPDHAVPLELTLSVWQIR